MNDIEQVNATRLEAIRKVYQHYIVEENPFGYDREKSMCVYESEEGNRCAIGLLAGDKIKGFEHCEGAVDMLLNELNWDETKPNISCEELCGLDLDFAMSLQNCHDNAAIQDNRFSLGVHLKNLCDRFGLKVPSYLQTYDKFNTNV